MMAGMATTAPMPARMRAISQRSLGGPEVLEVVETDRPEPGPGQVLVRVRAAGVNPADGKIRSGVVQRFADPPFTVGLDFSGVVAAVGEQVTRFRAGDDVYGCVFPPNGSYADYVVVAIDALAVKPGNLDHEHAAALPVTALTAWQALTGVAAVRPGQRVLVHAAAGGMGHLAVQIAKAHGAHVVGTARTANHDFLRELGADELIDYTKVDFAAAVHDVDVVLDPISGDYGRRSLDTLVPGGLLIDVRGTGPDRSDTRRRAEARGLRFVELGFTPSGSDLDAITELVEQGSLRVVLDRVLPLEDAATAHRLSDAGHVAGKIVLTM